MFDILHAKPSSCKDCPDRFPGCHSGCEKYKNWKIDLRRLKDAIYHEEYKAGKFYQYSSEYCRNMMVRKDRKRGKWIYDDK